MGAVYSAASLAYLGDAVIEVWVRQKLVESDYVTAPRQAQAMKRIIEHLSEDEAAAFRRGRNIGHTNLPRNATASEYRSATGMEALMGYLHMEGRAARIDELLGIGYGDAQDASDE